VSATANGASGAFFLTLDLRGLDAPRRVIIDQDARGVHVHVTLAEPRQVHAWAKQMGVDAETGEPTQQGGDTWWYRHTRAQISREGLTVRVNATQMALDPQSASMTGPVTA
jgi:hypothetical protein